MTVERTLQAMFDNFPNLFKGRADCYNQLFCTVGNGYEWVDGELIDICGSFIPRNPLKNGKAYQYNKLTLRQEAEYYLRRAASQKGERYEPYETLDSIPDDQYHWKPRAERWYFYRGELPLCRPYAYLFNYPDDIKPDWKAAIDECREMLFEDGYEL